MNLQLINCSSRNNSILSTEKPCLRPVPRQTIHIHIQNLLVLGGLTPENNPTNPHSLETSSLCIIELCQPPTKSQLNWRLFHDSKPASVKVNLACSALKKIISIYHNSIKIRNRQNLDIFHRGLSSDSLK